MGAHENNVVRHESGMTLIEIVVAMALLLGSAAATVSIVDATARATVRTSERVQAMWLAESALEEMLGALYPAVGLDPSREGFTDVFEDHPTVRVMGSRFAPREIRRVGEVDYTVVRHITWGEVRRSDGVSVSRSWKRLAVIVEWGSGRSVRLDSGVAPERSGSRCERRWVDPAETVTSVMNTYLPGLGQPVSGSTLLQVGEARDPNSPPVAAGDLLLVIQMTGRQGGTYEYAMATSAVRSGWIGVTGRGPSGGLVNAYSDVDGSWQVIRVPTFESAVLSRGAGALPWDGRTGGVVALDVDGELRFDADIDLTAVGLDAEVVGPVEPARLRPGSGSPKAPGGGLFIGRVGVVTGAATVSANGAVGFPGGAGGTVVLGAERGGFDGVRVNASGGTLDGPGGHVLLSADPARSDVSGGPLRGSQGSVSTDLQLGEMIGLELGVGCHPVIEVDVATSTPLAKPGSKVQYTIRVANTHKRGTAESVEIVDTLPPNFVYRGTELIALDGGATRIDRADPDDGAVSPRWGSFDIPPGGSVTVTFWVEVSAEARSGVWQNEAQARYLSVAGLGVSSYGGGFSDGEDVVIP